MFEAWTNPAILQQWLVPTGGSVKSTVDVRVGGKFLHEMKIGSTAKQDCGTYDDGKVLPHSGEYLEVTPPERLVFTWNSHIANNTRVTVELRDLGDSTEVWLTHELLDSEERRQMHKGGWESMLEVLDALLNRQ